MLAAVLLTLGLLAGVVNRELLDSSRFAGHMDAVRMDPAVSQQIGERIAEQAFIANPDLIAVRPLVQAAATALVRSPALSPLFQGAVNRLHATFFDESGGTVVLRLADLGAVLAAVLPALRPETAAKIPPDLAVNLASFGSGSFAAHAVHLAHLARLLGWLLPTLALLCFLIGLYVARDRWRATIGIGWAVIAAGAAVGTVALIGALMASRGDQDTLNGALFKAGWYEFGGALWWAAAITIGGGGLLVVAAKGRLPEVDLGQNARRLAAFVVEVPAGNGARLARGTALTFIGLAMLLRPGLTFGILGALLGLALAVTGVGAAAAAAGARRPSPVELEVSHRRSRRTLAIVVTTAGGLIVALVATNAAPAATKAITAATTTACNGHVELCNRPYNKVAYPATHNSMSAADAPGWFIPEQPNDLVGQLNAGIRVLLIDTWYGQTTENSNLVATAPQSYEAALAEAKLEFGTSVVDSALRLRDAITSKPTGPVLPYLCHSLCEIGATAWEPEMVKVQAWMTAHPREVVTFVIQDAVSPADTNTVFEQAGLLPLVDTPQPGKPWPTLQQMIDSGRRLVVLMENHGGGSAYPWLLQAFDWIQDTPYSNPTVADLSCKLERGSPSNPLLLINNWLSGFSALVSNARAVNAYSQLSPYLARCERERGQLPNYVAVNYYNYGDLMRAIDTLNGVS